MDYRELAFYQKAREVTRGIHLEINSWSHDTQAKAVVGQLFRAATSVGANIAEGHGRHEGSEYIHYLYIAQGSANEVDHWLHTALDCQIGNSTNIQRLILLNNETRKMLAATIHSLQSKRASKSLKEPSLPYSPAPISPIPYSPDENDEGATNE